MLFFMEEYMVKKYHVPFLGLPFEVWQAGPVVKDLFIDLSDGPFLLEDYIATDIHDGGVYIRAIRDFDDAEFSECEIEMMDAVLCKYGTKTAKQLVAEVHKKGSLWYEAAKSHQLLDAFRKHECNSSDYQINFAEALAPCAAESYMESLETHQVADRLKTQAYV
jgi:uncharacterized phage-associated protein